MKILFVAPWIPSEQRPRSLRILEMLQEAHDVHFVGLRGSARGEDVRRVPASSVVVIREHSFWPVLRALGALLRGRPLQEAYASSRALKRAVVAEINEWRPDVVHLNVFRTVHLLESVIGDAPVVVDLDEFRSDYYRQLSYSEKRLFWRMVGRVEAPRMARREREVLSYPVTVLVSGPMEARSGSVAKVSVLRSVCDIGELPPVRSASPRVLFVGRLSYEANVVGLRWFIAECWPGIKQQWPEAELDVVGSDPPPDLESSPSSGVVVHGAVESVAPFYASASLSIVPIFRGTGVQMKLLQSLAAGVPTVSTPDAAARAGLVDGKHVVEAETPSQWVAAVCDLLNDDIHRSALGTAGRSWLAQHHGRPVVSARLKVLYEELAQSELDGGLAEDRGEVR